MSQPNDFCERESCKGCKYKSDCNRYSSDENEDEDEEETEGNNEW